MIVRMWEAKAHPEAFPDLLSWVCDAGVPAVETHPLHVSSEVFASTDHRIVVITRWRSGPGWAGAGPPALPDPPKHLLARPPHSWDFAPVDR